MAGLITPQHLEDIRLVFFLQKLRIVVYGGIQYAYKKQFCGYESATLVDLLDVIYHETFFLVMQIRKAKK